MTDDPIPHWHALTSVEAGTLATHDPVVLLPVAAVEQHGPHLPLSTDLDIGLGIVREAFRQLPPGFPAWVLPPVAVGVSLEHTTRPGTVAVDASLLEHLIDAYASAVRRAGVRRLVIVNSHGGNRHGVETAALRVRAAHHLLVVKVHAFLLPCPDGVDLPPEEWRHGLHGGAVETSMMLYLHPDRVRLDAWTPVPSLGEDLAGRLRLVGPAYDAASFAWMADDLSASGVTGDVRLASVELGRRLVEGYGRSVADAIQDARDFPLDRLA